MSLKSGGWLAVGGEFERVSILSTRMGQSEGGEAAYIEAKCSDLRSLMSWQLSKSRRLDHCHDQTFI